MSWQEDWDRESNNQGWRDGRNGGMNQPSLAMLPRSVEKRIGRVVIYILVLAGIAGGAFAAYQSVRIAARTIQHPHSPTKSHKRS